MATLPDAFAARFAQTTARGEECNEDRAAAVDDASSRREFAVLYERHAPRVQRFLRDVLRDDALAWDATQETFARAYRHLALLRDVERAAPWLFGVARNVSFEIRRTRARAARLILAESGELERATASATACPEADYLGREAMRVIDAALLRLSEDRRAALVLRLDHGLTYEQISVTMEWSLAKVKIEIFRAREVLRDAMLAYEQGHEPGNESGHEQGRR